LGGGQKPTHHSCLPPYTTSDGGSDGGSDMVVVVLVMVVVWVGRWLLLCASQAIIIHSLLLGRERERERVLSYPTIIILAYPTLHYCMSYMIILGYIIHDSMYVCSMCIHNSGGKGESRIKRKTNFELSC